MPATYEVQSGDTLSAIAREHQASLTRLLRLNPGIENPDLIFPGQKLTVPASDEVITSRSEPGKAVGEAPCEEEIVEIIYQTGSDELIFLTQEESDLLREEEAITCGPIEAFYRDLDSLSEGDEKSEKTPKEGEAEITSEVQQRKQALVDELVSQGIISGNMQTIPPLTEIKRLSGEKHVTFVRSDKMKNHPRRYSIASRDKARSKGWLTKDGIDGKKLAKAAEENLKVKVNVEFGNLDPDGPTMQTLNHFYHQVKWSIWGSRRQQQVDETGFDASAEAQFMRFAAGASGSAEFNPKKGKVHLQARADAQYALAEGKISVEQAFPTNNKSEIRIYYREGGWDGPLKHSSLGHFQAVLAITASGFAGASALLAGNVHVDSSGGLPKIKGIAARKKGQEATVNANVFAGVRAGCEVSGELRWEDVLSANNGYETLCKIGEKVEAALGAGAELEIRIMFSDQTGKFYFNCHAGLVLGVGAAGSFLLEVSINQIMKMLHFIYNALLDVDFRYLEIFDQLTDAFLWYKNFSLYSLGRGISAITAAEEFAANSVENVTQYVNEFFDGHQQEQKGLELAENILKDMDTGEDAVFLHSPPEVKGIILDSILYDWWLTPGFIDGNEIKVEAVNEILRTFQSWRDFEETVSRMNSEGKAKPAEFEQNLDRLFEFAGKDKTDQRLFIHELKNKVAIAGRPVKLDPFGVCRVCGIA